MIGLEREDGTVLAVYCHWDGYPSHNGRILRDHYDAEKTEQLLRLGNVSILHKNIGVAHEFDARPIDACTFYGRDRGEDGQHAMCYNNAEEYMQEGGHEYMYLLCTNGVWYVNDLILTVLDALGMEEGTF
jgi:hypothetical protein